MRGMSGIGHHPGMRRLPRPGWAGGAPEFVSMPGLPGRRSRAGWGPWGTVARDGSGRGVRSSVPCKVTVRELPGRTASPRVCAALCPAARAFPAPPQGATCGVQPRCIGALSSALVGVQPTTVPGAPSRGAGKAAASSRHALRLRRASVVTSAKRTAMRSERASDDAGTCNRQSADRVDTQRRKRVLGAAQVARWSGAKWCQCSTVGFSSGNLLRSGRLMPTGRGRVRGATFRAGGTLYMRAL